MDKYATVFSEGNPDITIARFSEESHSPELQTWVEMSKKDLVITSSKVRALLKESSVANIWQNLSESLLRGALAITQIRLMIIVEAQNIKNQDCHSSMPIVQVMNDFYRVTDAFSRPRVFALAAPPPDRRSHFDSKMLKLEQTLDAKVFGVTEAKRDEILALPDRPDEIVILYDFLQRSSETRLMKQLHQLDPSETVFRRHYVAARHAHDEVGPCASDLIWRRALKDMDNGAAWFEDSDGDDDEDPSEDGIKHRIRNVVRNWAFTMPNLDASSKGFNVAHKFLRLIQVLNTFKAYGDGFRGIIFGMICTCLLSI